MKRKLLLSVFLMFSGTSITLAQAPVISYNVSNVFTQNTAISPLNPVNTGGAVPATIYGQVSTITVAGAAGGVSRPQGIAVDASGNVYVADRAYHRITKITPEGVVSTLAGVTSSSGVLADGKFNNPLGVAVDASGNIYASDQGNIIRKITSAGVQTHFSGAGSAAGNRDADGDAVSAEFYLPFGMAFDASGNMYVADRARHKIRKVSPTGDVVTFAGAPVGSNQSGALDGIGTDARFNNPVGIAVSSTGDIYVSDNGNNRIRKINATTAQVETLNICPCGGSNDGPIDTDASFNGPFGLTFDNAGNLYIADYNNHKIRKMSPSGIVTTLAGSGTGALADGIGTEASFKNPADVAIDASGNLYVADYTNDRIRKISTTGYTISPQLPAGLSFDATTGIISGTPTEISPATDYTVTAYNTSGSSTATINITVEAALPVSLVDYSVSLLTNGSVELIWKTSSETNNSHFNILRSTDGKDFKIYTRIDSKGNEGGNYIYTDSDPNPGINYYKLVQTDKDGVYKELGLKSVNVGLTDFNSWKVFPNPVSAEKFTISGINTIDKLKLVKIIDLNGKAVFQKELEVIDNEISVNISKKLPAGIYLLEVDGISTKKIVIE
ncbi:T9SS type A sorting domain-containing protein (plasmid) [Pedobacter sp. BS3]|uniref:NHL domain-containing protein n=1 Tax=Pedobacter sp. BS3 TaxID=2567937 RepID=UPI0011EEEC27|nr:putative Ig domain-containing protein [Pedobacter sp. BS3]TZF86379.1 T9SS type A sorting domain-containing protein [Pedobacter sp. BS3]